MSEVYRSPKTTVAAIISRFKNDQEEILLTKRGQYMQFYKEKWCLPGGHIDPYEKAYDAVVREVKEETGLDYTAKFLFPFDEIIRDKEIHAVVCVYQGTAEGHLIIDDDEVNTAEWVPLHDAINYDLAFQHREVIQRYLELKS